MITRTIAFAAAAIATLAAPARADEIEPPPPDCPDGARGESSHCGPFCEAWDCSTDGDCQEGTCQSRALCVEVIQCTHHGGLTFDQPVVLGPCDASGACARGTCRTQRVCARATPAPTAPPPPPGPGPTEGPGAGCRLAPSAPVDALLPLALAAALAVASVARKLRRA